MAKLTTKQRNALPALSFAGPGRSFPVNDLTHAKQAIRMSGHAAPATAAKIKAKVHTKFPQTKPAYSRMKK